MLLLLLCCLFLFPFPGLSISLSLCLRLTLAVCVPVCRVLLQCELDVDSMDVDGWTALHAAAHWGQEEVCSLLADHMCDMAAVNNVVSLACTYRGPQ